MGGPGADLFGDLRRFIATFGVRVPLREMDIETPGEFDGLTITINPRHDRDARSYYLAHAFGSIAQWSTDFARAKKVFDELRHAKKKRQEKPAEFEAALEHYRKFEQTSSKHAVWMLAETGHTAAVKPYTLFFRADIEAMTLFHRTGKAPRWPDFYAEWKRKASTGGLWIEPFRPKPVSRFRPVPIEPQEVLQERD